jgi:hypothetical protein
VVSVAFNDLTDRHRMFLYPAGMIPSEPRSHFDQWVMPYMM